MREVIYTSQFKRDFKKLRLADTDLVRLTTIIEMLSEDMPLDTRYRDHSLTGNWKGYRECHLKPDLLLIYQLEDKAVTLMRIGSHSTLFK